MVKIIPISEKQLKQILLESGAQPFGSNILFT